MTDCWYRVFYVIIFYPLFICNSLANQHYRFSQFDVENGLSQNSVNAIIEDQYGFLWFGTQDGLNRFDGYRFEVFKKSKQSGSLSANWIETLFIDTEQRLWIGTLNGGLNLFDHKTQQFSHYIHNSNEPFSISHNRISAITQLNSNTLLIATQGGGVNRFDIATGQFSHLPKTEKYQFIHDVKVDSDNNIWIATAGQGVVRLSADFKTIKQYQANQEKGLSSNKVHHLLFDSQQQLWAGSDSGLNRYNRKKDQFELLFTPNHNSKSANVIRDIIEDHKQRLWLVTNFGLIKIDQQRQRFTNIKANSHDKHSLSANALQSIYLSKTNMLWIGTFTSGLNLANLNTEQFEHYKHKANEPNSLAADIVWNFTEDPQHNLWVSTDGGGISKIDIQNHQYSHFRHDPNNINSLSSDLVWSVLADGQHTIWAGTYDAGLNKLDTRTGKFQFFIHDNDDNTSITSDHVIAIFIDSDNTLWVGTDNGLDRFDRQSQTFQHFKHNAQNPNSLSHNEIFSIIEDQQNRLWIATAGGGINIFDKTEQSFTHLRHQKDNPNSIPNDIVAAVNRDSNGNIWAATYGGGIAQINPHTLEARTFDQQDGLINNATLGIIEGEPGQIWVSSNSGLSVLNLRETRFINFTMDDGLQHNEFGSGAYLKTHDGKLLFGGIHGFNRFDPKKIKKYLPALTVTLTQLRVDNHPVAINPQAANTSKNKKQVNLSQPLYLYQHSNNQQIQFNHHHNLVSFEFATLTHQQLENIEFQYKLQGFDQQWIDTDHTLRIATYTNLPSGNYQLNVRARLPQTPWPTEHTRLSISKKAAPWASIWSIMFYILIFLLGSTMFLGQRMRRAKLARESQERLELALWGSHCDLWDWDLTNLRMFRSNRFRSTAVNEGYSHFSYDTFKTYTHPEDVGQLIAQVDAHINNHSEFIDATYRRKGADGLWRWYRSRAKAVVRDNKGKALRIVGIIEDINELKQIQTELKQINDELETRVENRTAELTQTLERLKTTQIQLVQSEKMASLVELVVGISHELNTPLGVALTASSHVQDALDDLSHKTKANKLTKHNLIQSQNTMQQGSNLLINNLKRAIELLRAFKSLSPASDQESYTTFCLAALLEKLKLVNRSRTEKPAVELHIDCPENLELSTYKDDLIEILLQLLDNSYTHAFAGIEKPKVTITVVQQVDIVIIKYADNGIGLTEQSRKKMFEPFYTSRRGSDCTGLGLAIIYNQVYYRLHGSLEVTNESKPGFELTLTLPQHGSSTN